MKTKIALKKIDHFVITTARLDECLAFYQRLGFQVELGEGRYALFAGDFKMNVHLYRQELTPHAGHVQPGSTDICFEVNGNLQALHEELSKAKLNVISPLVARHGVQGIMRSFYLHDPDGNLIELSSYDS